MSSQSHSHDAFAHGMNSNAAWSSYKAHQNPDYFNKLSQGQTPSILWLGCSDSRVPETTLLGLQPGDVFVHRNIANIVSPTDINSSAVIEYAVVHLKVMHIVVCGHTSCGGAAAALGDSRVGGVLDTWLTPLKKLRRENRAELEGIEDAGARASRMAELNVESGVETLMAKDVVEDAIKERGLVVHGVLYDLACGQLRDLGFGNGKGYVGKGELRDSVEEEQRKKMKHLEDEETAIRVKTRGTAGGSRDGSPEKVSAKEVNLQDN